jgi:hypothetical protein
MDNAAKRAHDNALARKYYWANPERSKERSRRQRAANLEKIRARDRVRQRARNIADPARFLFRGAKKRARLRGVPFGLTLADIIVPAVCPVLGIQLSVGAGRSTDASPTLDRIVPPLGYIRGNIIVISNKANRIKNDATIEDLRRVADFFDRLTSKEQVA